MNLFFKYINTSIHIGGCIVSISGFLLDEPLAVSTRVCALVFVAKKQNVRV